MKLCTHGESDGAGVGAAAAAAARTLPMKASVRGAAHGGFFGDGFFTRGIFSPGALMLDPVVWFESAVELEDLGSAQGPGSKHVNGKHRARELVAGESVSRQLSEASLPEQCIRRRHHEQ